MATVEIEPTSAQPAAAQPTSAQPAEAQTPDAQTPDAQTPEAQPRMQRADRLVIVVGFDGSEPSYRALDAASLLILGRTGSLEVVYVAHAPVGAEMSAATEVEALKAFQDIELELGGKVRARLDGVEPRWHFQRRNGIVARELIAVADQTSREYGGDAAVVLVVGSAMHTYHHVVGSVPVALVRHARYPVVVVP